MSNPSRARSRAHLTVGECIEYQTTKLSRYALKLGAKLAYLEDHPEFADCTRYDIEELEICIRGTYRRLERLRQYPVDDELNPQHPYQIEAALRHRTQTAMSQAINWGA